MWHNLTHPDVYPQNISTLTAASSTRGAFILTYTYYEYSRTLSERVRGTQHYTLKQRPTQKKDRHSWVQSRPARFSIRWTLASLGPTRSYTRYTCVKKIGQNTDTVFKILLTDGVKSSAVFSNWLSVSKLVVCVICVCSSDLFVPATSVLNVSNLCLFSVWRRFNTYFYI